MLWVGRGGEEARYLLLGEDDRELSLPLGVGDAEGDVLVEDRAE